MIRKLLIVFFVTLVFASCEKDDPVNNDDPYGLTVELISIDSDSKEVKLLANAQNTVLYALHIDYDVTPADSNTTGLFTHTFSDYGVYDMTIRAYGASGRYIKGNTQIVIESGEGNDTVPLNKGYFTPLEYEGYNLYWNDEFNGTSVSSDNWSFETGTGNGGWGNNELQYYTADNAIVEDETLIIEARKEQVGSSAYTSARLISKNKVSFKYGRVDIRALMPHGKGLWPALWMLGENITSVSWPACGEIDIMEMIGNDNNSLEKIVHGTIHYDNNGHAEAGGSHTLSTGSLVTSYYVYTIIWDETSIRWYIDDFLYHQENITSADKSEFHQNFWFIMNVAVGGNWPGSPNEATIFPQRMKVDYIRVFQKE